MFSVTQHDFESNQRPPIVEEDHFNLGSAVSELEQSVITAPRSSLMEQSTERRSVSPNIDKSEVLVEDREPLCQLNIQLSANTRDSVVLYAGESPRSVAASFALKHSLPGVVEKVLTE